MRKRERTRERENASVNGSPEISRAQSTFTNTISPEMPFSFIALLHCFDCISDTLVNYGSRRTFSISASISIVAAESAFESLFIFVTSVRGCNFVWSCSRTGGFLKYEPYRFHLLQVHGGKMHEGFFTSPVSGCQTAAREIKMHWLSGIKNKDFKI